MALVLYDIFTIKSYKMKYEQTFSNTIPSNTKTQMLILSLLFYFIGMLTYIIPFFGEVSDVFWAPISALLLFIMYRGTVGKLASVFGFIKELLPFVDIIPTFTITWFYTYVIKKESP